MFERGEKLQRLFTVLATWVVLFAFFFAYEAYFVSGQREFLSERGFRVLASLSKELSARVNQAQISVASSIKLVAPDAVPASDQSIRDERTIPALHEYLSFYLQDEMTTDGHKAEAHSSECRGGDSESGPPLKTTFEGNGLIFRFSCFARRGPEPKNSSDLKSEIPIQIQKLDLSKTVRQAFAPLDSYFDDVLVADSTGRVVFQQSGTGPVVQDLKVFAPNKNSAGSDSASQKATTPPTGAGSDSAQASSKMSEGEARWIQGLNQANTFSTVTLGEDSYYLFSQPVRIPTGNYSAIGVDDFSFVVCRLRSASSFEATAHAVPYTILIWLSLLVAALFSLSWPLFKLRYMSNTERFSPRDGWFLIFAIFLASTSIMMMFLNYTYGSEIDSVSDYNTRKLARQIRENVKEELNTAALQLRLLTPNARELLKGPNGNKFVPNYLKLKAGNTSGVQPSRCYPYFEIAFWADSSGKQLMKFDVHPVTTPPTNVATQQFFKSLSSDVKQMSLSDRKNYIARSALPATQADKCPESPAPDIDPADHVHLAPEFSPNTGEFYVVLASPVLSNDTSQPDTDMAVQVLATRPLSLVAPVLPPGYSFAVIDQQCDVLFDSDSFRDLKENFCEESKSKDELTPWLFSGVDKAIDITYSALPGRAFLTSLPLPGLVEGPAYLIVFRDPELKPSLNLAIIFVSSILMGIWFLLLVAAAVVHLSLREPFHWIYAPEFTWPSPANAVPCVQVFIANGVMCLLFWSFYQCLYEGPLLCLTVAVAIFTVVFSVLKLCHKAALLRQTGNILTLVSAAIFAVFLARLAGAHGTHGSAEPIEEWLILFGLLGVFGQIAALLSRETLPVWASRAVSPDCRKRLHDFAAKHFSVIFALAALSAINAVGLVPCAGFFKYSFDAVSELSLKRDQITLSEEILERKNRLEQYYENLNALPLPDDRLSNPSDRYDSVFFTTASERMGTFIAQASTGSDQPQCIQYDEQAGSKSSDSPEIVNDWIEKNIARATLFSLPTK